MLRTTVLEWSKPIILMRWLWVQSHVKRLQLESYDGLMSFKSLTSSYSSTSKYNPVSGICPRTAFLGLKTKEKDLN